MRSGWRKRNKNIILVFLNYFNSLLFGHESYRLLDLHLIIRGKKGEEALHTPASGICAFGTGPADHGKSNQMNYDERIDLSAGRCDSEFISGSM